jgi:hypothetical protein
VQANGGIHVIQTFLSNELSEEIQIKGRAARQGDAGSYSMVLIYSSLEKFKITHESVRMHSANLYDHLNKQRTDNFDDDYNENITQVGTIKDYHAKSMKFLEAIYSEDVNAVKRFILQMNTF